MSEGAGPVQIYLARQQPSARSAQRGALRRMATLLAGEAADPETYPWHALAYGEVAHLREQLTALVAPAMAKIGTAMPKAIADSAEANKAELKRLEDLYAGTISGGFGRGTEEGVGFAKQQVDAWRRDLEATPIVLRFDVNAIRALFEEISKGQIPKTTGSAP